MPARKKNFPCGHRAFGRFCHRCAHATAVAARPAQSRAVHQAARAAWAASFDADPIDLRGLPRRELVYEARRVIAALAEGQDYRTFGGKQLVRWPGFVSVPLGHHYRLIFNRRDGALRPYGAFSHEQYNGVVARLGRAS